MRRAELLVLGGLLLAGCRTVAAPVPPPIVTGCLQEPTAAVPDEPARPAVGAPIPDTYVVALVGYANTLLGAITADRTAWRGERRCIGALRDAGVVR